MPTIEELLALDLLTLREHTERAGDHMDATTHAVQLRESLAISHTCSVRRDSRLVAYAMLNQVSGASWFVRGFNIHPAYRSAPVIKDLMRQVGKLAQREGIVELRSHVYQTNRLSLAFHHRLGFRIAQENERAVEFFATVAELAAANPFVAREIRTLVEDKERQIDEIQVTLQEGDAGDYASEQDLAKFAKKWKVSAD